LLLPAGHSLAPMPNVRPELYRTAPE